MTNKRDESSGGGVDSKTEGYTYRRGDRTSKRVGCRLPSERGERRECSDTTQIRYLDIRSTYGLDPGRGFSFQYQHKI